KASKPVASLFQNASLLYRRNGKAGSSAVPAGSRGLLPQDLFTRTLYIERKRSERSGRAFVLMTLESPRLLHSGGDRQAPDKVLLVLPASPRDTDIKGWYKDGATIGVIFTELGPNVDGRAVIGALLNKVITALSSTLTIGQINEIKLSFRVYPENWEGGEPAR